MRLGAQGAMRKGIADGKERRGKAQEDGSWGQKSSALPLQSHLTCSYLHAVQSQRNWGFPATAQGAPSSTSPLEGERRGQSVADAAEELSERRP